MTLRAKLQFMDRPVTYKLVYRSQLRFGSYNILWVTSRSINCTDMTLSAMTYLLNIYIKLKNGSNLITKYVTYLVYRWGKKPTVIMKVSRLRYDIHFITQLHWTKYK